MTRIIGGSAGGRRLETPRGDNTRPTSDRVREALFSALESWAGTLDGLRVLDLYAGSGALGLEAWSRGAAQVTLVEHDRPTAAVINGNVRTLRAEGVQVLTGSVTTVLGRGTSTRYDVVLMDPPYPLDDDALAGDLELLVGQGWLAPDALVVIERGKRSREPRWPAGLEAGRKKAYGETILWYGHGVPDAPTATSTDAGTDTGTDTDVPGEQHPAPSHESRPVQESR